MPTKLLALVQLALVWQYGKSGFGVRNSKSEVWWPHKAKCWSGINPLSQFQMHSEYRSAYIWPVCQVKCCLCHLLLYVGLTTMLMWTVCTMFYQIRCGYVTVFAPSQYGWEIKKHMHQIFHGVRASRTVYRPMLEVFSTPLLLFWQIQTSDLTFHSVYAVCTCFILLLRRISLGQLPPSELWAAELRCQWFSDSAWFCREFQTTRNTGSVQVTVLVCFLLIRLWDWGCYYQSTVLLQPNQPPICSCSS